ncbi:MAG: isoprenylcysteine carboxylmethyltransferase family protein [Anaerolineaceae bacterium]|nr:isoprenylcysteine carboxylmethyltransferase family protein [Anaerolineaceae bacterium]
MNIYSRLLIFVSAVWITFEIALIIRDRLQGKGTTAGDQGTRYINFIAIFAGITISSVLEGNSRFWFPGGRTLAVFWLGFGILLVGAALRVWAIVVLGSSFRTTVELSTGQRVVRRGPYRLIRHPSYTGILLMCCGYGIADQNALSLIVAIGLPLLALLYRIHVEEAALAAGIGPEYQEYQRHTKKLIPGIW